MTFQKTSHHTKFSYSGSHRVCILEIRYVSNLEPSWPCNIPEDLSSVPKSGRRTDKPLPTTLHVGESKQWHPPFHHQTPHPSSIVKSYSPPPPTRQKEEQIKKGKSATGRPETIGV